MTKSIKLEYLKKAHQNVYCKLPFHQTKSSIETYGTSLGGYSKRKKKVSREFGGLRIRVKDLVITLYPLQLGEFLKHSAILI